MNDFLSGALMMACLVAGLLFLRFWRKSRDRLFLMFGIAFWILAANRFALVATHGDEIRFFLYCVRLLAFLLILAAIIDKNRRKSTF